MRNCKSGWVSHWCRCWNGTFHSFLGHPPMSGGTHREFLFVVDQTVFCILFHHFPWQSQAFFEWFFPARPLMCCCLQGCPPQLYETLREREFISSEPHIQGSPPVLWSKLSRIQLVQHKMGKTSDSRRVLSTVDIFLPRIYFTIFHPKKRISRNQMPISASKPARQSHKTLLRYFHPWHHFGASFWGTASWFFLVSVWPVVKCQFCFFVAKTPSCWKHP